MLLDRLPASRLEGMEVAKIIRRTTPNLLECGRGGTSLMLGDACIGDMLDCPVENGQWVLTRTSNIFLLQIAYGLITGRRGVEMTTVKDVATIGKYHLDITGTKQDGTPRGPFKKIRYDPRKVYQCLWNNDSNAQRAMAVDPDCTLEKKPDATVQHVDDVWRTRTHLHFNLQVRYTSQRLVAAYTTKETVGGSTWPNVILDDRRYEKAFAVWFNSVFGILAHWFVAGSQHTGRGLMTKTSFKLMPVPDFDALADDVIGRLDAVFDDMRAKEMDAINRLDADEVRRELDRRVMDILKLQVEDLEQVYEWLVAEKQLGRTDLD